ncbi:hypothetical protein IWW38_006439, partial [Coemansia aciculifera]
PAEDGQMTTEYQVRYFEDGSYSMCRAHEMVLLDPTLPPFSGWVLDTAEQRKVVSELAFRRALAYYEWRFIAVFRRQLAAKAEFEGDSSNASVPSILPLDLAVTATTAATATISAAVVGTMSSAASPASPPSPVDIGDIGMAACSIAECAESVLSLSQVAKVAGVNEISRLKNIYQAQAIKQAPTAEDSPEVVFDHFFDLAAPALQAPPPVASAEESDTLALADGHNSRECIQPYLHQIRDLVHIIDGRDGKVYQARIREVEFVDNGERFGLYYFVHYQGWNAKFDEWVPPSRIIYLRTGKQQV